MIQWTLFYFMIIMNFIFINMKHPLAMGLILLIQTTLISISTGLMTNTFWFSYILFLVFLGGLLVLFIYITSLASNEMFSFSIKLTLISLIMFMMLLIMMYTNQTPHMIEYKNLEIKSTFNINSFINENSLSLNKLYNYPSNLITILLMNYLLITLIVIVKIVKMFKGPLRPMFN